MSGALTETARVDEIRAILDDLIRQRRTIGRTAADDGLRHANKLGIVYWQWQLRQARTEASLNRRRADARL